MPREPKLVTIFSPDRIGSKTFREKAKAFFTTARHYLMVEHWGIVLIFADLLEPEICTDFCVRQECTGFEDSSLRSIRNSESCGNGAVCTSNIAAWAVCARL